MLSASRSSAIMSISGRALAIAAVTARMSAAVADAANERVITGKLPFAWRPPMKRATRNGPLRTTSSAIDSAACPPRSSVATRWSGRASAIQLLIQIGLCAGE